MMHNLFNMLLVSYCYYVVKDSYLYLEGMLICGFLFMMSLYGLFKLGLALVV